jgi:hypothetical protein
MLLSEQEGHVALAGEVAFVGNLADGQTGLRQQGSDALQFDAPDFLHNGSPDLGLEMVLGVAAGGAELFRHIRHRDGFVSRFTPHSFTDPPAASTVFLNPSPRSFDQ